MQTSNSIDSKLESLGKSGSGRPLAGVAINITDPSAIAFSR